MCQHLIGSRILRELRALGYSGGSTPLYRYLKGLRTAVPSSKATVRFETPPGRQGQFDWSPYTLEVGGELTKVIIFGLTLGYSRRKHYAFSLDETQASIFEAIEGGFHHFKGAPKELLVDNARALVTDSHPEHFRWNPQFLELCGHYRVQPRACRPYRARTGSASCGACMSAPIRPSTPPRTAAMPVAMQSQMAWSSGGRPLRSGAGSRPMQVASGYAFAEDQLLRQALADGQVDVPCCKYSAA